MTVTVLALVSVAEDAQFELAAYLHATQPLLERAGAKIVQRFTINEVVVGHRPAKTLIIVEYPNREAVDMVFGSPEYRAIIPMRDIAFPTYHISIVEEEKTGQSARELGSNGG